MLIIPGLTRGPQPTVRQDDVDRPAAHTQPLALRVWEGDEAAAIRPRAATGSPPGLHRGAAPYAGHGMPAWPNAATGGGIRRWGGSRLLLEFSLCGSVKNTRQDDCVEFRTKVA